MKINTALIMCAGYGKRLNPLTLKIPKPLLRINNITLLENCINLIKKIGINKILINTFYLSDKINQFIEKNDFDLDIKIINDGDNILDTGGGILNMVKFSDEENFIIFNPDTLWNLNYKDEIIDMENFYFNKNLNNILLVVKKEYSFDQSFIGDFNLSKNKLIKEKKNHFIYTGVQIINKKLFKDQQVKNFSISKIWNNLSKLNQLNGFDSKNKFYHLTDLKIYNKLSKY
tara:strand:+ start:502 stop:1191 length:690 start_codon:yes stop_codon:yes gene_type:complete